MPTVPETQAFLTELKTPSVHTNVRLKKWLKTSATVVKLRGQQIALVRGLLQEAEGEEPSEVMVGKMETLMQQVDAQARILDNIARELRDLRGSLKDAQGLVGELRGLAQDAGYTLP